MQLPSRRALEPLSRGCRHRRVEHGGVLAGGDKPLGMSTALSQAPGACAAVFMGWEKVGENACWAKHVPQWDYGMLFLLGTFLGAMVSAVLGK